MCHTRTYAHTHTRTNACTNKHTVATYSSFLGSFGNWFTRLVKEDNTLNLSLPQYTTMYNTSSQHTIPSVMFVGILMLSYTGIGLFLLFTAHITTIFMPL